MGEFLFLSHRVPFPPNRGDKIRAHHLLMKIAELGPVHVGCLAENTEDREGISQIETFAASHCVPDRRKPLMLAGAEAVATGKPVSLTAFHSPHLSRWVKRLVLERPIDAIFVFSGQMGQYIPDDYRGRVVVDLCDVDSAKFESYADAGERVWLNRREGRLLALEEERLARRADATVFISKAELDLFNERLRHPEDVEALAIGNGIDAAFFDPFKVEPHRDISSLSGPHFVFTGQMDYRPNEQAASWVIETFLPAIRNTYPTAQFHIVGRNPTRLLCDMGKGDGVTVWGEVRDVRPYIAAADCMLAPLMIARGVQNKVLEAMAMERPVLLTPEAATGISAKDGEHWVISDADERMVEKARQILDDREFARSIGREARQFVLRNHAWGAMLAPLEQIIVDHDEDVIRAA